jgi:hypothetical protein
VRSLRLAVRPFVSCLGPWWIRVFMGGLALIGGRGGEVPETGGPPLC